jgi:hypothetical protein
MFCHTLQCPLYWIDLYSSNLKIHLSAQESQLRLFVDKNGDAILKNAHLETQQLVTPPKTCTTLTF